jgi:hypothetical protein
VEKVWAAWKADCKTGRNMEGQKKDRRAAADRLVLWNTIRHVEEARDSAERKLWDTKK